MARPSLKAERRTQIMAAFGRCLARYGLEGASLERVAEEAGLARALIRHNVGNRDELIDDFVADFLERSKALTAELLDALPTSGRVDAMLKLLFDRDYVDTEGSAIANALLAAVPLHPGLDQVMAAWNDDFTAALESVLKDDFPEASALAVRSVATGISGLFASADALAAIDSDDRIRLDSLAAARRLAASLSRS